MWLLAVMCTETMPLQFSKAACTSHEIKNASKNTCQVSCRQYVYCQHNQAYLYSSTVGLHGHSQRKSWVVFNKATATYHQSMQDSFKYREYMNIYIYIQCVLKALELFLPMHTLQYQKTIRGDHLSCSDSQEDSCLVLLCHGIGDKTLIVFGTPVQ